MHSFSTTDGEMVPLPEAGVLVGAAVQDLLDVDVGDRSTLAFPSLGTEIEAEVAGFVDEPLGTYAYMDRRALADALASSPVPVTADQLESPAVSSGFVIYQQGADGDQVQDELAGRRRMCSPWSARRRSATSPTRSSPCSTHSSGSCSLFGGIMAFALIFNTISVNISERATELATMRANGLSSRQVNHMMTLENLILTLIGIPIGLVVGRWVAAAFMSGFSSDLFQFDLQVKTSTYVFIALAILAVTLISQWPGLRAVRRLDIAGIVRERAQ